MIEDKPLGLFEDEFEWEDAEQVREETTVSSGEVYMPPDVEQYPERYKKIAYQRLALIKWVEKRIDGGWTQKQLVPILSSAREHFSFKQPSWRTLARWYSDFIGSGRAIESLVPKHNQKGKSGNNSQSDGGYFQKILEEHYLTIVRPTRAESYRLYKSYIVKENNSLIEGRLKPICEKTLYNRIERLSPYEVALKRYGKAYADRKYRTVKQLPKATRVLERVEIDHSPLDMILVDDDLLLPLGRPYLTVLIDSYSKCVVGLYVGYKEPSYDSVRRALTDAYLPKDWVREKYPNIKKEWPCEGKIGTLVVDNGAEFWSSSLEDACLSQVGNIDYNQTGQPWLKPSVERFFLSLNKQLCVSLPGKTFSSVAELKGYRPDKDAVIRFSTFMELLYKWVVDDYHFDSDARETTIPILKWYESVESQRIPVYRGALADRLRIDLAKVDECALLHDGIHIHSLRYASDALTEYRKNNPAIGVKNLRVKVKTIHTSVAEIYVYLEAEKRYLRVPCVDQEYALGLTLLQHETNKRFVRNYIRAQTDVEHLAEARVYLNERTQQEVADVARLLRSRQIDGLKKMAKYHDLGSDNDKSLKSAATQQLFAKPTECDASEDSWEMYEPTKDAY